MRGVGLWVSWVSVSAKSLGKVGRGRCLSWVLGVGVRISVAPAASRLLSIANMSITSVLTSVRLCAKYPPQPLIHVTGKQQGQHPPLRQRLTPHMPAHAPPSHQAPAASTSSPAAPKTGPYSTLRWAPALAGVGSAEGTSGISLGMGRDSVALTADTEGSAVAFGRLALARSVLFALSVLFPSDAVGIGIVPLIVCGRVPVTQELMAVPFLYAVFHIL